MSESQKQATAPKPNVAQFKVYVTQEVEVTINLNEMTEEWMAEFRKGFYDYYTVERHAEQLAWLAATGSLSRFAEGYGVIRQDDLDPYPAVREGEYHMDINVTVTDDAYEIEAEQVNEADAVAT